MLLSGKVHLTCSTLYSVQDLGTPVVLITNSLLVCSQSVNATIYVTH